LSTPPVPPPENPEGDFAVVTQAAAARTATAIYNFFNARLDALEKAMLIGDTRLADHIAQQVADIREALLTAERLELERVAGLRREIGIGVEASDKAIGKQESANEKRFDAVNDFHAQLRAQQATFMPREVMEKQIEAVEARVGKLENLEAGHSGRRLGVDTSIGKILAAIGAVGVLVSIVVVLSNLIGN